MIDLTKRYTVLMCAFVLMFTLKGLPSVCWAEQKKLISEASPVPVRADATYQIKWYEGFDLQSYIKGEKLAQTLEDIKRQLQSNWKWKSPFYVYSVDERVKRSVNSCGEFFKAKDDKLYPLSNVDRGPYSYVGLYCFAAQLILDGKSAKKSYIENLKVDGTIAKYLPSDVKYRISSEERRYTSGSWADVEKLKAVKVTNEEVEFSSRDADHFVRKIAVGDFNNDGVQDILLMIGHHVKEGTHFENYLYVMTRTEPNGLLRTVKRYTALED